MRPLTRSCFLLFPLGRLSLLAFPYLLGTCLPSLWSPLFPLHAPALIPLSLSKVRRSLTLNFSHLAIWYSGQTALFFFLLAKAALAYFPTAFSMAMSPHFPFQQALYAQVSLLKTAAFGKLFASLGSTNKPDSSLTHALSLPLCLLFRLSFYLNLSGRSGRNCPLSPPILSGYNGSRDNRFSRKTTRLMSWPDGERYLRPLQSLIVSLLFISRIHSFLFSDWRRTVSSKFFDTQVPSISTEELVLPRHARCVLLSSLQRTQPCVKHLSL